MKPAVIEMANPDIVYMMVGATPQPRVAIHKAGEQRIVAAECTSFVKLDGQLYTRWDFPKLSADWKWCP